MNRFHVSGVILSAFFSPVIFFAEIPVTEENHIQSDGDTYSIEEKTCLYKTIYGEARSESPIGQELVATVILNRVENENYPNTICGVVKQKRQFSMWEDHNLYVTEKAFSQSTYSKEVLQAIDAGMRAIERERKLLPKTSLHYHADYVSPKWSKSMNRYAQADSHIFYMN